mmetsp:Transcript_29250/g.71198  ORF Transcript_29250/g.71198 Transcript_29250/m.71198 type:complete len:231 (-) Transcript_29250:837-1529(-)
MSQLARAAAVRRFSRGRPPPAHVQPASRSRRFAQDICRPLMPGRTPDLDLAAAERLPRPARTRPWRGEASSRHGGHPAADDSGEPHAAPPRRRHAAGVGRLRRRRRQGRRRRPRRRPAARPRGNSRPLQPALHPNHPRPLRPFALQLAVPFPRSAGPPPARRHPNRHLRTHPKHHTARPRNSVLLSHTLPAHHLHATGLPVPPPPARRPHTRSLPACLLCPPAGLPAASR